MEPDLTVVLLGKSGVGKSASGNTILGRTVFESRLSFKPVTKEITTETCGQVFGKRISVVDTPGILDTEDTEREITAYCQGVLQSNRPCLFLVVVQIDRFTPEEERAVEAAIRALGPRGIKKSYLLFTKGDALKSMKLEDFIFEQENGLLPNVVMKFGAYHVFNNEIQDQDQVRKLLLKAGYIQTSVLEEPVCLEDRRIVLLGRPGGGKSSSGNTILGSKRFNSDCDFESVTAKCVSGSAAVEGRQVTVVDTPGFTDQVLSLQQLYMEIMKTVELASPGPHAFVIVVRIGRVSEYDIKLFELLPKLFGADALKYTMVLFTHGDELRGQSIDQKVRDNRFVSKLVSMCGGRSCVFDNTQRGNAQQVRTLLKKVDEMVTENGGNHCSSEMFAMAETFIREEKNLSGGTYAAPRGTYAAPGGTYAALRGTYAAPGGTYAAPGGTYAAPCRTYAAPGGTYAAPGGTYAALRGTYAAPGGTYAAPGGTYAAPGGTYAALRGTYAAPGGTYAAPGGAYAAPGGTYAAPGGTYAALRGTYAAPGGTYAAPGGAYAAPGGTYAAPGGTYAAPGGTYAALRGTYAAPGGTYAAPGGAYAAPGGTYAAPGGTYAAPGGTSAAPGGTSAAQGGIWQRMRPFLLIRFGAVVGALVGALAGGGVGALAGWAIGCTLAGGVTGAGLGGGLGYYLTSD